MKTKKQTIQQIIKKNKLKLKEEIVYPIIEYDKNKNVIHCKYSDGYESWYEYDKNNKCINELTHYSSGKWELNDKEMIVEK